MPNDSENDFPPTRDSVQDRRLLDSLLTALRDESPDVRCHAVDILADESGPVASSALLDALRDSAVTVRIAAIEAVALRDDVDTTPALIRLLHDPDAKVRAHAVLELGRRRSQSTTAALLEAASDTDSSVRISVIEKLADRDTSEVAAALCDAILDTVKEVRAAAAESLCNHHTQDVVKALLRALTESEPEVRAAAVQSLKGRKRADVEAALLRAITDRNAKVRAAAIKALPRVHQGAVKEAVVHALTDGDWKVRVAAVQAIRETFDKEDISLIVEALGDSHTDLYYEASIRDLQFLKIDSFKSRTTLRNRPVALAAAATLVTHLRPEVLDHLVAALWDHRPIVTESLIWILAGQHGQSVTDALVQCLGDARALPIEIDRLQDGRRSYPTGSISRVAHDALALRSREEVVQAVSRFLADAKKELRIKLLAETSTWSEEEITSAVLKCLTEKDPEIRCAAVLAVGERPSDRTLRALSESLNDPVPHVQRAVVRVLLTKDFTDAKKLVRETVAQRLAAIGTETRSQVVALIAEVLVLRQPELLDGQTVGPFLLHCWGNEDPVLQQWAGEALQFAPVAWIGLLLPDVLPRQSYRIGAEMSRLVARCGQVAATPWLAGTVIHSSDEAQFAALQAVGRIGDPIALAAVLNTLGRTNDDAFATAATDALQRMGPAIKPSLQLLLGRRGVPDSVLAAAIHALGTSGSLSVAVARQLFANLDHASRDVRTASATALRNAADMLASGLNEAATGAGPESRGYAQVLKALMDGQHVPKFGEALDFLRDRNVAVTLRSTTDDLEFASSRMTMREHLRELYARLTPVFLVCLAATTLGALFWNPLVRLAANVTYRVPPDALVGYLSDGQHLPQIVGLNLALWLGIPFLTVQLWIFTKVGLYPAEKNLARPAVLAGSLAVLAAPVSGAAFARLLHPVLEWLPSALSTPTTLIWMTNLLSISLIFTTIFFLAFRQFWRWLSVQVRVSDLLEMAVGSRDSSRSSWVRRSRTIALLAAISLSLVIFLVPPHGIAALLVGGLTVFVWFFGVVASLDVMRTEVLEAACTRTSPMLDLLSPLSTTWIAIGWGWLVSLVFYLVFPSNAVGLVAILLQPGTAYLETPPSQLCLWTALTTGAWLGLCVASISLTASTFVRILRNSLLQRDDPELSSSSRWEAIGLLAIVVFHIVCSRWFWEPIQRLPRFLFLSDSFKAYLTTHLPLMATFVFTTFAVAAQYRRSFGANQFVRLRVMLMIACVCAWFPTILLAGVVACVSISNIFARAVAILLAITVVRGRIPVRKLVQAAILGISTGDLMRNTISGRRSESQPESAGDPYASNFEMGRNALAIGDHELSNVYIRAARDHVLALIAEEEIPLQEPLEDSALAARLMRLYRQASLACVGLGEHAQCRELCEKCLRRAEQTLQGRPLDKSALWHAATSCSMLSTLERSEGNYEAAGQHARTAGDLAERYRDVVSSDDKRSAADLIAKQEAQLVISEAVGLARAGRFADAEEKLAVLREQDLACGFAAAAVAVRRCDSSPPPISPAERESFENRFRAKALESLESILGRSQPDQFWLETDMDLQSLRNSPQFMSLLSGLRTRQQLRQ